MECVACDREMLYGGAGGGSFCNCTRPHAVIRVSTNPRVCGGGGGNASDRMINLTIEEQK